MAPTQSSKFLEAYSPEESWKRDHEVVKTCFDLEDTIAWGVRIFRGLTDSEARYQARAIRDKSVPADQFFANMYQMYKIWLSASEFYLDEARKLVADGYDVEGLEEFEATVEEASCLVENLSLEDAIPSIEELSCHAKPFNPDVSRYGD